MIEVEVKVQIADIEKLKEKLKKKGFIEDKCVKESNVYFDNACNEIKSKDQALRIRSCEDLSQKEITHFLTFKGPKMDTVSMTRKELEMQVESAEIGKEILTSLGYIQMYPVIKHRQYYHKNPMAACLDQVEGLGDFLELEIVVNGEREKTETLNRLMDILKELGYESEDIIRESYLSMIQAKK